MAELEISKDLVKRKINRFKKNEGKGEKILKEVFEKYNNGSYEHVMIKAIVLDKIYSTRIRYVDFPFIVQNIVDNHEKIEELLNEGTRKYELFDLIAKNKYSVAIVEENCEIKDQDYKNAYNAYSFATKYLSFIKPDLYPIMDSYSRTLLSEYIEKYKEEYKKE